MGWSLRVDCLASTPAPLPQRTVGVEDVCVGRMSCRHLMPVCFLGWGVLPGGIGPRLVLSLGKCGHWLSILPWPPRVSVPPGAGWGQAARGVRVLGPHGSQGQEGKPGPARHVHENPSWAEFADKQQPSLNVGQQDKTKYCIGD